MRTIPFLQFISRSSLALLLVCGSTTLSAQSLAPGSIRITPHRIVLQRSPKLAKEFPERKTAVVRYPTLRGLDNPQALKKIQTLLAVKNVFGMSLTEYREDAWLEEFDYKVGYNKNYLFDVTFSQSGMGAYPDSQFKHFIIDLRTGNVITAADAFDRRQLPKLAKTVDAKLQAEIREIISNLASDKEMDKDQRESLKSTLAELKFKLENLYEFEISAKGITFLFDAGFPHVIQALQPDGRYFFSLTALKPYIRSDGPLAPLVSGN